MLITVNEKGEILKPGKLEIRVRLTSLWDTDVVNEHTVTLNVIDAKLPELGIYYTNRFHYDCLSDIHNIPLYSDEYFEILGKYLKNVAMHGMNTLLIPTWTPPLDTLVGEAMNDYKALKLLEKYIGYHQVMKICEKFFGEKISSRTMPANEEEMIKFREMINYYIEKEI